MEKTPGNGTKEGGWHDGAEAARTGSKRLCGGHHGAAGMAVPGAGMVLSAAGPHAAVSPRRVPQALRGFFCWPHGPFRQKKTGLLHISAGQSCLAARGRRTGFRGFRKGAAQRAVFFSSGASGLFSRFSSGISSLLMMVSICSSFFTSSLGKRLFTRWTTVLR